MAGNTTRHLPDHTAAAPPGQGPNDRTAYRTFPAPWSSSSSHDPRTTPYISTAHSSSSVLNPIHPPHTPQAYASSPSRDNYTHTTTPSSSSPSAYRYPLSYTHSPTSPARGTLPNAGSALNGQSLGRGLYQQSSNQESQSLQNQRHNSASAYGWPPTTLPVPSAIRTVSDYDNNVIHPYTGPSPSPVYNLRAPIKQQPSHECFVGKQGYPQPRPRCGSRTRFSPEDDQVLKWLKEQTKLSWKQIADFFPDRKPGTLQVRYCTKLKDKEQPPWTYELEDQLTRVVDEVDTDRWKQISHKMGGKFTPEACKEKFSELQEAAQLEQDDSTSTQSNPDVMEDE